MNVRDIMSDQVKVIGPQSTLQEAARLMDDVDVGALPVCDGDRLVGVITDRDIIIRAISAGKDPTVTVVADAMTGSVSFCFEDQSVGECARIMERKQVRRLPVLSREGKLVGIVSMGDIACKSHDEHLTSEVAHEVSKPFERVA